MQRRPLIPPIRIIGEYIWRLSLCKEGVERWNIGTSCGIVDVITRVWFPITLITRVLFHVRDARELFLDRRPRVAENCAQALRNEAVASYGGSYDAKVGARSAS